VTKGRLSITVFTDPSCPFGFSAAPDLLALRWLYGDQIEWQTRLVLLADERRELSALGITSQMLVDNETNLANEYGMPITPFERDFLVAAKLGDVAVKAVQLNRPELGERYLRALQVAWHTDRREIDKDETIFAVAEEIGIDREDLKRWRDDPATLAALDADVEAARDPMLAATGPLDHKLAGPDDQRRYTCPSLEIHSLSDPTVKLVAPGFQNHLAYDLMIANADPKIERRDYAEDPLEVLRWADWPLAAVEVGRVMGKGREEAEKALRESGAIDNRGYWTAPAPVDLALGNKNQLAAGAAPADRLVSRSGF
jgi:predicted DsbA family dithiol-disulfide isomerase